jgi:hypothetical protein
MGWEGVDVEVSVDAGEINVGICNVLVGLAISVLRNASRVLRATVVDVRSRWG